MENELWAAEYQQSVPTNLEGTEDHQNNGNTTEIQKEEGESNEAGRTDYEKFIKSEPADHDPGPINIVISEKAKHTIQIILKQIKSLSQVEKFLLFLKLPTEVTNAVDPFRQPLNPLGSRSEIYRTISWIKTHLEEDPDISLPKQEVYNEYHDYCEKNEIKPLSQADFGKVMKQVYPSVRARRLGTRGNSRYCYAGLRRCMNLKAPILPDLADKPMSTEAPFTQSSLNSAAWLIVKEWSEQQLNQQFPTIQSLAYHLLLNHSVGIGSEAATKISSASESSLRGDDINCKGGNKHREMQLQLQKKIQQKNESKERKRKMQSPKSDQRPSVKKSRSQSVPTPSAISPSTSSTNPTMGGGSFGECSTASSSNSGTCSPAQGKVTVCDRSPDFTTQLPALPDFDSFQRPTATGPMEGLTLCTGQEAAVAAPTNKVPIPRLQPPLAAALASVQEPPSRRHQQQAKYKSLRPRLRPHCDIASYNPRPPPPPPQASQAAVEHRSQDLHQLGSRIKERNSDDDECDNDDDDDDVPNFPLTRERLESVSSVSKDAMDEYLGTNNSQHEEELSKYFSNNNTTEYRATQPTDPENTSKLSTLRLLLEQNIVDCKPPLDRKELQGCLPLQNTNLKQTPVQPETTYITPLIHRHSLPNLGVNIKRRVSSEISPEEAVPPSPNTRRKNFSFMPISPGPRSPNGTQSKCSSTTASPFVSPSNTPILRMKTVHQNAGILKNELRKPLKAKREINLTLEIPNEDNFSNLLPMSAPVSPMPGGKSVLQKLLNSTNKVSYSPGYGAVQTIPLEVCQFSAPNVETNLELYRSQSMLGPMGKILAPDQPVALGDFAHIDPIPERILNSLDEQSCDNNNIDLFNLDITPSNACLQEFGLQLINNNSSSFPQDNVGYNNARTAIRSHSIGEDMSALGVKLLPSRSVPSTPLPYNRTVEPPLKANYNTSRSYPSTPMNSEETFNYNVNTDCLLNGQPIRTDCASLELMQNFEMNDNNVEQLTHDKGFSGGEDYVMVENDSQLIGDVLMDPNYAGNME